MSAYKLSDKGHAKRNDTIEDLHRVNNWRNNQHFTSMRPKRQSIKAIEKAVALGLIGMDLTTLPDLVRGKDFYNSIFEKK